MAIEVFSDSPTMGMSPARISFSHDLTQNESVPIEQYIRSSSPSSSIDFDFCVFRETFDQESSADELFFDGKILPIEIKKKLAPLQPLQLPPLNLPPPEVLKDTKPESEEKQSIHSKSWFKRSASLNCGSGNGHSFCPLPLLSRSNSTGSNSSGKRSNHQKQNLLKNCPSNSSQKQQQSQSAYWSKPPLKKSSLSHHGGYSNGVKFNPVLNVPTVNLFGLGSIFSGGNKDKNKKK